LIEARTITAPLAGIAAIPILRDMQEQRPTSHALPRSIANRLLAVVSRYLLDAAGAVRNNHPTQCRSP
jgi:hypothetical protein